MWTQQKRFTHFIFGKQPIHFTIGQLLSFHHVYIVFWTINNKRFLHLFATLNDWVLVVANFFGLFFCWHLIHLYHSDGWHKRRGPELNIERNFFCVKFSQSQQFFSQSDILFIESTCVSDKLLQVQWWIGDMGIKVWWSVGRRVI